MENLINNDMEQIQFENGEFGYRDGETEILYNGATYKAREAMDGTYYILVGEQKLFIKEDVI